MSSKNTTIGIDLGDRRHAVCVLSAAGAIVAETDLANTRECLTAFAQRYPGATFVMETGTHSPWVSRLLESLGHHVIVANARKLRAISTSHTKNDQEDARMLARLGRADPALLSPVKHRSESAQRALLQLKVREALVRSRVNQINSTRFLLKSLGVLVPAGRKAMTFTRKLRAQVDLATAALVEPLLTMIDALNVRIKELDHQLEAMADEQYPVTARLRQVPGVGPLTATALIGSVPHIHAFTRGRQFASWLGLTPRESSSGRRRTLGGISKRGDRYLRSLLAHGARSVLRAAVVRARSPQRLTRLHQWGLRLRERRGQNRAVIAVANKLARIIWAVWSRDLAFT